MPTLPLTAVWVNRLDTGEAVTAQSLRDRDRSHAVEGSVQKYANGRMRSMRTAGEAGRFAFTLVGVSQVTIDTLRLWAGDTVAVRDHRGQRFLGVYYGTGIKEDMSDPDRYNVTLNVETVTVVEDEA